ncbi:glycosyltransferase family A protein [Amphibacillus sediminis]|uniref:glycosyltransferase family A protein n=1 Tax=Amphibacillus sediminis TaxID=360185 RepID=UPI000833B6B9|nr:glycosyltransferase family 2 protein [Amphibacillus sediminis]
MILSIIIPHYHTINTLERLLHSIPKNDNVEIIIVDDNSEISHTDLHQFLSKFPHRTIRLLFNHKTVRGAGVCRNIGLSAAQGKWVLFADADDFFVEGFFEKISVFLQSNEDVVFFPPTSVVGETSQTSNRHVDYLRLVKEYRESRNKTTELMLKYKFKIPVSKLISLDFIKRNKINFDEVIASNDVMFSTKVGYHMEKFIVSDQTIYCIVEGYGSLTKNTSAKVYDARLDVFIDYHNFLKEHLDVKEFKLLNIHGRYHLANAFFYKLGIKKGLMAYRKLRKNKVKLFDLWLLNPYKLLKRMIQKFRAFAKNKKFLVK